jgi:multiple sugar transport system permease protein
MGRNMVVRKRVILVLYALLIALMLISVFPLVWLLLLSLKSEMEAFAYPPLLVFKPKLVNFLALLSSESFMRSFANSFIIATGTVVMAMVVGVPAAYGISRGTRRFRQHVLVWTLITRMAPGMIYIIPFFVLYVKIGLIDTRFGLMLIYLIFTLPLVLWTMTMFFDEVPKTLEEAAKVDGAGMFQGFFRVILPLSAPGLGATAILCFIFAWNEFLFALILARRDAIPAPVAIVNFMAFEGTEWGKVAASGILVLLPVLLFSLIIRKYLVKGLMGGAIKG